MKNKKILFLVILLSLAIFIVIGNYIRINNISSYPIFKDVNLSDYFGNYTLGKVTTYKETSWTGEFPSSHKVYQWPIIFNDYYQNQQTYFLRSDIDFSIQISNISRSILENEVKTLIIQKFTTLINISNVRIGLDDYQIDNSSFSTFTIPITKEYYPKNIAFKTFFSSNSRPAIVVHLSPKITDNEISDVANFLINKSNKPVNLIFRREENWVQRYKDVHYYSNKLIN